LSGNAVGYEGVDDWVVKVRIHFLEWAIRQAYNRSDPHSILHEQRKVPANKLHVDLGILELGLQEQELDMEELPRAFLGGHVTTPEEHAGCRDTLPLLLQR
jgi:hypothetical protein